MEQAQAHTGKAQPLRQHMPQNMTGAEGLPQGKILCQRQQFGREDSLFFQRPANTFAGHPRGQVNVGAGFKQNPGAQGRLVSPAQRHGHAQAGLPELLWKFWRQGVTQGGIRETQKSNAGIHVGQS